MSADRVSVSHITDDAITAGADAIADLLTLLGVDPDEAIEGGDAPPVARQLAELVLQAGLAAGSAAKAGALLSPEQTTDHAGIAVDEDVDSEAGLAGKPYAWGGGSSGFDPVEPPDPDLDDLTRDELAELDGPASVVASVLDDWVYRLHGITQWGHNAGTFLDLLAAQGYRVEPIQALAFEDVLQTGDTS